LVRVVTEVKSVRELISFVASIPMLLIELYGPWPPCRWMTETLEILSHELS